MFATLKFYKSKAGNLPKRCVKGFFYARKRAPYTAY